jgi:hypothetical protein
MHTMEKSRSVREEEHLSGLLSLGDVLVRLLLL